MTMTEPRAKRILGDAIKHRGLLWFGKDYRLVDWFNTSDTVRLHGRFHPLELEAISWWVRHKARRRGKPI